MAKLLVYTVPANAEALLASACILMVKFEAHTWARIRLNTLRLRRNGHRFPDDIFKHILLNENVWISIKISLKFVPKGPINNIPAFVPIMAWRRTGDKPLSEVMTAWFIDAYMHHLASMSLKHWHHILNHNIQCKTKMENENHYSLWYSTDSPMDQMRNCFINWIMQNISF